MRAKGYGVCKERKEEGGGSRALEQLSVIRFTTNTLERD